MKFSEADFGSIWVDDDVAQIVVGQQRRFQMDEPCPHNSHQRFHVIFGRQAIPSGKAAVQLEAVIFDDGIHQFAVLVRIASQTRYDVID